MTFRDPEAARRACADPAPIIDGRRANCNLASLGRPRLPMQYATMIPNLPGQFLLLYLLYAIYYLLCDLPSYSFFFSFC